MFLLASADVLDGRPRTILSHGRDLISLIIRLLRWRIRLSIDLRYRSSRLLGDILSCSTLPLILLGVVLQLVLTIVFLHVELRFILEFLALIEHLEVLGGILDDVGWLVTKHLTSEVV
jgi:hypothetical protein